MRGQWPEAAARALAGQLPYWRRLAASSGSAAARASLAGVALALRALERVLGRRVAAGELVMARGAKPHLAQETHASVAASAQQRADFSISHSGPWVGCAAVAHGRVGLDIEMGTDARISDWVMREAVLKATGAGLRAADETRGLELRNEQVHWRGELWHVRRLEVFPGARACVLSSRAPGAVDAHLVQLAELFVS